MNTDRFKFRVWDENRKTYKLRFDTLDDMIRGGFTPEQDTFFFASVDGYIIEQCTGLRDKNGKLIYEGDVICLVEDGKLKHTAIVRWGDSGGDASGAWIAESTTERYPDGRSKKAWFFGSAWEIICNIHGKKEEK